MLYTIIGLLLVVAILVLRSKNKWFNDNWPFFLILIIWFFGIMALFGNGEYFDSNEPRIVNIGSVSNVEGTKILDYLTRDDKGNYYFVDLGEGSEWKVSKVPDGAVLVIIQSEAITKPSLKITKRGYKANAWTFSIGNTRETYTFELPLNKELAQVSK